MTDSARRIGGFASQAAEGVTTAGNTMARALGSGIAEAGKAAVDWQTHSQVSQGEKQYAQIFQDSTDAWARYTNGSDPLDSTVAKRFQEEWLEPRLEKFKESFTTDKSYEWADQQTAHLRQHMFQKTAADMMTRAGDGVAANNDQTINTLSNTVRGDPSSLAATLKSFESSTELLASSSPGLSPADQAKLRTVRLQEGKEHIALSAAYGYVELTGKVPPWASDPEYAKYLDGGKLKQLESAARVEQRLAKSEARSAREEQQRNDRATFNGAVNDAELSLIPEKAGDPVTLPADYWDKVRQAGKMNGAALEPGRLAAAITKGEAITERMNKPEPLARVSHDTTVGLLQRMRATDDTRLIDNTEFYNAFEKGDLSTADLNFLNREWATSRTPDGERLIQQKADFIKAVSPSISKANPLLGKLDPDGSQNVYRLEWDLTQKMDAYRRAGKDPRDLLNPASPDYFGSPAALAQYSKPMSQSTRDAARRMSGNPAYVPVGASAAPATPAATAAERPTAPTRQPNETPEQYLKRVGAH